MVNLDESRNLILNSNLNIPNIKKSITTITNRLTDFFNTHKTNCTRPVSGGTM